MQKNTFSTIIRNISYGIFTVLLMSVYLNVNAQLTVDGKKLLDPHGDQVIIRGVENVYGMGLSEDGWFVDEIAQTGANAIRFLADLGEGQLTLTHVDNILSKAKNHGMVVYMTAHSTVALDWFERTDVYNLLQKYEDYIIIDAIAEHSYKDEVRWASDCKNAIDRVRARGYTSPINVISDDWGRNHTTIINKAAEVLNHDPLKNVMFNVQAYWNRTYDNPVKYSTQVLQERLAELDAIDHVLTIGICPWSDGSACDDGYVDYKTAMTECEKYGFGYLFWEWHNPYEWSHVYQLTYDGHFGHWNNHCERDEVDDCRDDGKYGCDYGYQVCIGHPASIQNTSVKTPFLLGQTEVVNVTGVSLNQNTLSLEVGQTGTLTATVEPTNASNKAVSWSSSNEAVATVIGGVVIAASEGTATITATTDDGGFTDDCIVDVVPAQLYTLTINNGSGSGDYTSGTVVDISADAAPEGQQFAQWTIDVANVANVNSASTTITMPASSATLTATYEDIPDEGLLTGTLFDNISPYSGNPDVDGHAAFDGDVSTYVDAGTGSGAYTGLELNNPASLTMIRYYPRANYAGRMVGGIFQGSNDGVNYVDLHTISTEPGYNWNEVVLTTEAYSYYRYMSAPEGYCNVAEIEFWGTYRDIPEGTYYTLTVNSGNGSGDYTEGTVVNIEADAAPEGQQFDQWTGDVPNVTNINSASTTVTMPASNVTLTATYEDMPDEGLLTGTQFDNISPYSGDT